MVKLQHKRDRGPGEFVLVNGTKYELDAEGCIEVSEADATKLQLGGVWRTKEHWDQRRDKIASATPPPSAGGGRRVRTHAEMLALAEADGVVLEEPAEDRAIREKDPLIVAEESKRLAKAEAEVKGEDTIEVSEDMSKAELLSLASDVGLKVNKNMSKAQILTAFDESAE